MTELRLEIEVEETSLVEEFALSRRIEETVLARFPNCPICGGEWRKNELSLSCDEAHDRQRIIRLQKVEEVGIWKTNRGDVVARLYAQEQVVVAFSGGRTSAWTGRQFKSVEYEATGSILPLELMPQRERILEDLAELKKAREALEAVTARIKTIERQVGNGQVKRLTFRIEGGKAVARDGRTVYVAEYTTPYPDEKETWFCRLGLTGQTMEVRVTRSSRLVLSAFQTIWKS